MANELAIGTADENGGWGGDILLTATGDFLVLVDTPGNPVASQQRLRRIVMTNPIGFDQYGNPVSRPDDLFNPWFGSGVRRALGQPLTATLAAWLQNQIFAGIAADPNFVTTPTPVVQPYIDGSGDGQLLLYVAATTTAGAIAVLPGEPIVFF